MGSFPARADDRLRGRIEACCNVPKLLVRVSCILVTHPWKAQVHAWGTLGVYQHRAGTFTAEPRHISRHLVCRWEVSQRAIDQVQLHEGVPSSGSPEIEQRNTF